MNVLASATVKNIVQINATTVAFVIDLKTHVHLRQAENVRMAMMDYTARYPRVAAWQADIDPKYDLLTITVNGIIDWNGLR